VLFLVLGLQKRKGDYYGEFAFSSGHRGKNIPNRALRGRHNKGGDPHTNDGFSKKEGQQEKARIRQARRMEAVEQ